MQWMIRTLVMSVLLVEYAWGAQLVPTQSGEADRQYRFGVRLQQEGRLAEAIEAFRSTLRLDPMRASAYVRLKETYSRSQTGDQVRAELRQRTDQDETDFVSWNLLGVLYAKQGRWAKAMAALQRTVQIQPRISMHGRVSDGSSRNENRSRRRVTPFAGPSPSIYV